MGLFGSALTSDLVVPDRVRRRAKRRGEEFTGLFVLACGISLILALVSWSANDPSLNHSVDTAPENLLGYLGSVVSDLSIQVFGLAAVLLAFALLCWGWRYVRHNAPDKMRWRMLSAIAAIFAASLFAACLPVPASWPLPTGLGGALGDMLRALPSLLFGGEGFFLLDLVCGALGVVACLALYGYAVDTPLLHYIFPGARVAGHTEEMPVARGGGRPSRFAADDADGYYAAASEDDEDDESNGLLGRVHMVRGAMAHHALSLKARLGRLFGVADARGTRYTRAEAHARGSEHYDSWQRIEPRFGPAAASGAADVTLGDDHPVHIEVEKLALEPGERVARERQKGRRGNARYVLPPLYLLSKPPHAQRKAQAAPESLEANARQLEGVLEDFGVRGQIINVRPGPVVTLYELEPAPGIKSSRVIGLADDIARSMSAISARVAVVPGRNVIGIELPNVNRTTVHLREILASDEYEKARVRLPLTLGKTIGGEPVISDLARMPHLLIAGTTGSGKSVGINAMILSLLYRLPPDRCKMIMVDPKMLELSVYDGIPHLLSPVVTDPKKAVVALKWTVREMEERYKKMSKLGVRNIDGFNDRVKEALATGEKISRVVQTGFDRETGQAVYESEEMELEPMPYLVVVVDEMADLMMVAGKDIEGAIQRLAQMARAAGIHLIMATQRPSVDVITGTIKANFPTRISFQVTSKIDSRTILGEQGAEQLLGQGDMLFMAGGGRISRVHGPFVSDGDVEQVVKFLKSQGVPEYLEAITAGDDGEGTIDLGDLGGGNGDDLYNQALEVIVRDGKASTSYIQRRLQIGYNRAATLVERLEQNGVISPANHAGKREILIACEED